MGPIETAIRKTHRPGQKVLTAVQKRPFVITAINEQGIVLLLGSGHATPISWQCLERIAGFLRGAGWVMVGQLHSSEIRPDTLDGYLKRHLKRAAAGYVAVMLTQAMVVDLGRFPLRVRLREGF